MPGFDAGSIQARLELDRTAFQAGLEDARGEASDFESGDYSARLDADSADFDEHLDDAEERLDTFDDEVSTATLDADDEDAQGKIDDIMARIDELSSETAMARVDVDDASAKRKLTEIQAALDTLKTETMGLDIDEDTGADIDRLNGQLDQLDTQIDQVGNSADNSSRSLDRMGSSADHAADSSHGLMDAALALSPALLDIGTVAAAGIAGIIPAIATGAVGLAGFALAAEGDLSSVETSAKRMLTVFQSTEAPAVLPALTGGVTVLGDTLQAFEPTVTATGHALSAMEGTAERAFGDPYWHQFFSFLSGEATGALATFGNLLAGTGTALSGLTEAFAPLTRTVEDGLDEMSAHMERFGEDATSNTGLAGFMRYAEQNAPLVGSALESITRTVVDLGEGFGRIGPGLLTVVTAISHLANDIMGVNPAVADLVAGGIILDKTLKLLPFDFADIKLAMAGLQNFDGLTAGTVEADGAFQRMLSHLGFVNTYLSSGTADAYGLAGAEEAAGVAGETAGEEASIGWAAALGPLALVGTAVGGIIALFATSSHSSQAASQAAQQYASTFVQSVAATGASLQQQEAAVRSQIAVLEAQQQAYIETAGAGTQYNDVIAAGSPVSAKYSGEIAALKTQLANLQSQYAASAAAAADAAPSTQTLAGYITSLGSSSSTASSDLSNLSSALGILSGNNLTAQQSIITAQQDLQTFATSLAGVGSAVLDTSGNIGTLSAGTLTAQSNAIAFSQQLNTLIGDMAQGGDSAGQIAGSLGNLVDQFNAAASKAGLITAQIAALDSQYHLTQSDLANAITILINSGEIKSANTDTTTLLGLLGQTGADTVTTHVDSFQIQAAGLSSSQLLTDLQDLNGYHSTAYVTVQELVTGPGAGALQTASHAAHSIDGHAAGLAMGAMGAHTARVAEGGRELMFTPGGHAAMLYGPFAHIPAGAGVLNHQQTEDFVSGRMPSHADGLDGSMFGALNIDIPAVGGNQVTLDSHPTVNINVTAPAGTNGTALARQIGAVVDVKLAEHDRDQMLDFQRMFGTG